MKIALKLPECNDAVMWHPYELELQGKDLIDSLRYGDLYKCPLCGFEVITGFGHPYLANHFSQDELRRRRDLATRAVKFYFEQKSEQVKRINEKMIYPETDMEILLQYWYKEHKI